MAHSAIHIPRIDLNSMAFLALELLRNDVTVFFVDLLIEKFVFFSLFLFHHTTTIHLMIRFPLRHKNSLLFFFLLLHLVELDLGKITWRK